MLPFVAFLSGICGLGYEIVWTRALGLVLGHETAAAIAVVAAFFAGLALGSFALSRVVARSFRPARLFAMLEAGIGAWGCVLALGLPAAGSLYAGWLSQDEGGFARWTAAFGFTFLVLLPATFAMGGTLASLSRALAGRRGIDLPLAYALNTGGAVLGVLLATLLLLPAFGFAAAQFALAGLNGLSAGLAWRIGAPGGPAPAAAPGQDRPGWVLFVTGWLGIGYEVLTLRVVAQVFENTIYTFAALLTVFLLGNAIGGALMRRAAWREAAHPAWLCAVCAVACLSGIRALAHADALLHGARAAFGPGPVQAISAELACGLAVLFLPSLAMGALFARLASGVEQNLGRVLAANLAGAALAPVCFGVLLLPWLGPGRCLLLLAGAYLTLLRPSGRIELLARATVAVAILVPVVTGPPRLDFIAAGTRVLDQRVGSTATVSVTQDDSGRQHLQINSHFRQGGTASQYSDRREAFLPLLLHGTAHRALFLGLGTGATIGAARAMPGLAADGVELVPEVLQLIDHFAQPEGPIEGDPRITLHTADARRFVRASRAQWEVIVADLYFPAVDGAGALYTREHFAAIGARLAAGGVFCQWLPLHQMDLATLRPILRSYLAVFGNAEAWLAHYSIDTPLLALCGGPGLGRFGGWFRGVADAGWRQALRGVGLANDDDVDGLFIAGPEALAAFAGPGKLNTDDRPIATWLAPYGFYAPTQTPAARLLALLAALPPPQEPARLAALWRARNRFLQAGAEFDRNLAPGAAMQALAPKLLDVLRISPDFAPAYDPLLILARQLASDDPAQARELLQQMRLLAPARPEAAEMLSR